MAGEDLKIDLEGSNYHEATLVFSAETGNYTLVRDGNPVGNDLPDFSDRVRVSSSGITIRSVNASDVGRYRLYDRKERLVSVIKMKLVGKFSLDICCREISPFFQVVFLCMTPVHLISLGMFQPPTQHSVNVLTYNLFH